MTRRTTVACGTCTACCTSRDAIILHPDQGDDPALYQTWPILHPLTRKPAHMLAQQADGGCIYLDPGKGCSIHDHAPLICRTFSCSNLYEKFGAANLRRMVAAGSASQSVVDAGRKRLKQIGQGAAQ